MCNFRRQPPTFLVQSINTLDFKQKLNQNETIIHSLLALYWLFPPKNVHLQCRIESIFNNIYDVSNYDNIKTRIFYSVTDTTVASAWSREVSTFTMPSESDISISFNKSSAVALSEFRYPVCSNGIAYHKESECWLPSVSAEMMIPIHFWAAFCYLWQTEQSANPRKSVVI